MGLMKICFYVNHLKWHTLRDSEQLIDNVVYSSTGEAFEINKQQVGFGYGLELIKPFKRFNGGITLSHNRMNNFNVKGFKSNLSVISLSLFILSK